MYRQKCKQKPKWKIQLKTIQQAEQTPADVFKTAQKKTSL